MTGSALLVIGVLIVALALLAGFYYSESFSSFPKPIEITKTVCESGGGNWNSETEKCQCSGIAGFSCPSGYYCDLPSQMPDELGVCKPEAKPQCFYVTDCPEKQDLVPECISGVCVYSPA